MKTNWSIRFIFLAVLALTLGSAVFAGPVSHDSVWTRIEKSQLRAPGTGTPLPNEYEAFTLDRGALRSILGRAPEEFTGRSGTILSLPMPDGGFSRFAIEHSLIVDPALLVRYPELGATYRGQGIDDPTASVRFDVMPSGFHALILSPRGTVVIDPHPAESSASISYYKKDFPRLNNFECEVGGNTFESTIEPRDPSKLDMFPETDAPEVTSGTQLRTYRLALAATGEYTAVAGGGTVAGALAAQVTVMNRVNQVYERDVAIRMVIIGNNSSIIYTNGATDPYSNESGGAMLPENQANLDATIGSANYDIGHVFSTGGGGVASLNSPCMSGLKARGVTGLPNPFGDPFAIDFVAHEMGHQWGAQHTFNSTVGGCAGNRSSGSAYEPGSGISIMAYAGLCGSQNLANFSIDTFHVRSLESIVNYSQNGSGNSCAATTASDNTPPAVSGPGNFNIPKLTPFALTATATDVNGDTVTYDWQQYDLGPAATTVPNSDADGSARPIFRIFPATAGGTRTFPRLTHILNSANVPPNTTAGFMTGEVLPAISRTMNFQVVVRDNRANAGGINTATSTLTVDGNSGPFNVTSPNANTTFAGNSIQTVTWNVANTSAAPVSASSVKISMSTDNGVTFPTVLAANTANDGAQPVTIPVGNTTTARIKIEAVGNVFFDISDTAFIVSGLAAPIRSRADFDGDGRTDPSVYRPNDASGDPNLQGFWYYNQSTAGFSGRKWGIATDIPAPGDFDNDGKTDLAVLRPGATPTFYVLNSNTNTFTFRGLGVANDIPVVGDYDGDGRADFATYRASDSSWHIIASGGTTSDVQFGPVGSTPVIGDFDGDLKNDLAVFTGTIWAVRTSSGLGDVFTPLGEAGDKAVPADYNGDNKTDYAVFRPSNGTWYVIDPISSQLVTTPFGLNGDVPVPGDYDGDDRDDIAVVRGNVWYLNRSSQGFIGFQFGFTTDKPIPAAYLP